MQTLKNIKPSTIQEFYSGNPFFRMIRKFHVKIIDSKQFEGHSNKNNFFKNCFLIFPKGTFAKNESLPRLSKSCDDIFLNKNSNMKNFTENPNLTLFFFQNLNFG